MRGVVFSCKIKNEMQVFIKSTYNLIILRYKGVVDHSEQLDSKLKQRLCRRICKSVSLHLKISTSSISSKSESIMR